MRKTCHSIFLLLAIMFMALTASINADAATGSWTDYKASAYEGGDGSIGDPFQIATAEQLSFLSYNANSDANYSAGKYFVLTNEIDLAAHYWVPVPQFKGTFDGRSHKIFNLTIDNSGADYQGLFGQVNTGASISSVGIINCNITGGTYNGALAGFVSTATITGCYSTGIINGYGGNGGLVGGADTAFTLSYSWSSCSVTARATNDWGWGGGLVGPLWGGTTNISNCFATGTVTGWENQGGLVGLSYHTGSLTMTNCYSTGEVITQRDNHWWGNIGGLLGACAASVTISNSYHAGAVTMIYPPDNAGKTGGIVGGNDGYPLSTANSYYNSANTAGQGGGTAMTTTAMKTTDFVITLNASQSPAPWLEDTGNINNGFPMLDGMPGMINFISQTGMPLNTFIVSNPITIDFITGTSTIGITNGEYSISTDSGANWSDYSSTTPATVNLNNLVKVRQTSSPSNSVTTTATLTIGGVAADFNVTTAASGDPNATGLVSWWEAEGNAYDSVSGNHGTVQGTTTYSSGPVGQAFSFDATDAYASVPANSQWAFGTSDFAVAFWAYSSTNDDHRPLINNRKTPASDSMWAIEVYPVANRVEFHSGLTIFLEATNLLTSSSWNHIVVTRNGSTLSMYINGVLSGSVSNSSDFSEINDLQIGRDIMSGADLGGKNFLGRIDELEIFNRALSALEISKLAGTYPDTFSFTTQTGMPLSTSITSNPITVTGISSPAPISITNGEYSISTDGGGTWSAYSSTIPATVGVNDQVKVRQTSSPSNSTLTTATLTIGGVSGAFDVTTAASGDPNASGLVSWWKAEDNAYDSVGGNHGTAINGATYAAGKVGQSFSLDGINDYVEIPHDASLSVAPSSPMSFETWLYRTSTSSAQHIFSKRTGCTFFNYQLALDTLGHNGLCFGGNATQSCTTGGTSDLPLNTWTHIVGTSDGSTVKLFINGKLAASVAGTIGAQNTAPLKIGAAGTCGTYLFGGLIDEVKIFNRALSSDEVATLAGTKPDAFTFVDQTNIAPSTVATSTPVITVNGITSAAAISIASCTGTNCEYKINGNEWASTDGTVNNGDTVTVRQTSSAGYSAQTDLVLDIGGVTDTFSVTTMAIPQHTITASAGANGGISPSGAVVVNHGSEQAFTITPAPHYHVADVLVDGVSAGAVTSYTFTNVTTTHTITASFAIDTYSINASAGANGGISPNGTVAVNHGSEQIFTITPAAHYHVANVLVDGVSAGAVTSYTFTNVTTTHTIAATFTLNSYTLSVNKTGAGTVTSNPAGIDCGSDCSESYHFGNEVTLTAIPAKGNVFIGWSNEGCTGKGECVVTIDDNKEISVVFQKKFPWLMFLPSLTKGVQ